MGTTLEWTAENEFVVDGVSYFATPSTKGAPSTPERFRIIKARWMVERYERLIAQTAPKNIFELGIYDGGSTALIAQLARPDKIVAVDLRAAPCQALEAFVDQHGLRSSVAAYYGVDQADTKRLAEILDIEFPADALDLVIDDASHRVDQTRTSFNLLFPRLKPGGLYVIEDWSWAHNLLLPRRAAEEHATPLSVFVFELMIACAYSPMVIDELVVKKGWAVVRRGLGPVDPASFDVSASCGEVGQELMGRLTRP